MTKEQIPSSCERCKMWPVHGNKCWYYWEQKKNCTMHSDNQE